MNEMRDDCPLGIVVWVDVCPVMEMLEAYMKKEYQFFVFNNILGCWE